MPRTSESPGTRLLTLWGRLSPLPGGRWLFSRLLGRTVPYTDSMRATVMEFEPGHVRVELKDRRRVRNHLASVHAIALANLGELSTGLAVLGALPPTARGILTGIEMAYVKKARGLLSAEARCELGDISSALEQTVEAQITDQRGDVVATARATWLLSPRPSLVAQRLTST
jgi:acyl-coenzyme A thioesterase PaaI-like protein